MFVLCIYVFLIYSRVLEFFGVGTVTGFLLGLLIAAAMLTGNVHKFTSDWAGRLLVMYFLWLLLATYFSNWNGGSAQILLHRAGRAVLLYAAIVVLIRRERDFMRMVWTIALANTLIVCLAPHERSTAARQAGAWSCNVRRSELPARCSPFSDWPSAALEPLRLPAFFQFMPLVAIVLILVTFGKTGSRGGLVALAVAMAAHFWSSSRRTKIMLTVFLVLVIPLSIVILPGYIQSRFVTFYSADEDSEYSGILEGNDVASTMGRQELLVQGLRLTAEYPIFGIGPGEFADVDLQALPTDYEL